MSNRCHKNKSLSALWFPSQSHFVKSSLFQYPRSHQGTSRRRLSTQPQSASLGVLQAHSSSTESTRDTRWASIHCPLVVEHKSAVPFIIMLSLLPIFVMLRQQQDSHWLVLSNSGHICLFFYFSCWHGNQATRKMLPWLLWDPIFKTVFM